MKYIDIHCHLDFPDYEPDKEAVISRLKESQVAAITIGTDLETSRKAVEIADKNENVWACIGVHPSDNPHKERGAFDPNSFEKFVQNPKVVAIGECGLDYFRIEPANLESEKQKQRKVFEEQIEFALKYDKPLMLHCRDAYDEVLNILENYKKQFGEKLRGNCHFFAGGIDQAKKFLDLGFTMSFTGVITFARNYDEVIQYLPLTSIMSETDAPFVAPVPYRGKRNEPVYVVEVVKKLAEIKKHEMEDFAQILLQNAMREFEISISTG